MRGFQGANPLRAHRELVKRATYRLLLACGLLQACGDDGSVNPGTGDAPGPGGDARGADAPGGVGEPAELAGITLAHNQVRAAVQTPTPIPSLQWDPDLAAYAKAYTMMCIDTQPPSGLVDHNPARSGVAGYGYIGENIYASSGQASGADAVASWAEEKVNYDPASGDCTGGICGHYTQVVWRTTTHVGCALYTCPGLRFSGTVLCNYGPGGNSGGKAY